MTATLHTPEDTAALGARIAAALHVGEAVCLYGPLGAGKSVLARGLVRALTKPDEEVPSPTFTLVQNYASGRLPVAHFDLYRLKSPEEAFELGLEEALAEGAVVIEWPERLAGDLPHDRLQVRLRLASDADATAAPRLAELEGFGSWKGRERDLLRPADDAGAA